MGLNRGVSATASTGYVVPFRYPAVRPAYGLACRVLEGVVAELSAPAQTVKHESCLIFNSVSSSIPDARGCAEMYEGHHVGRRSGRQRDACVANFLRGAVHARGKCRC